MIKHGIWLTGVLVVYGLFAAGRAEGQEPTKWALLIGVDDYAEVNDLRFAGNDQRALAEQLKAVGFPADQVFLMHDKAVETKYLPNRNNIQAQLDLVLSLPEPGDTVVVAFSGHGVHLDGTSYLLPTDARLSAPTETMVEMARVYERLEACAANIKLLLVDACRNDPRPGGERGLTPTRDTDDFAKSLDDPPKSILQFTSCREGQVSIEEPGFEHGVFMHFLLDGLRGRAADEDGIIRLARLVDYVQVQTKKHVARQHNVLQSPSIKGEMEGPIELTRQAVAEAPRPNDALQFAGSWLCASTKATHVISMNDGGPRLTSIVDDDGEVYQVQSSYFDGQSMHWKYKVPSTGYVVTEVVRLADNLLEGSWTSVAPDGTKRNGTDSWNRIGAARSATSGNSKAMPKANPKKPTPSRSRTTKRPS